MRLLSRRFNAVSAFSPEIAFKLLSPVAPSSSVVSAVRTCDRCEIADRVIVEVQRRELRKDCQRRNIRDAVTRQIQRCQFGEVLKQGYVRKCVVAEVQRREIREILNRRNIRQTVTTEIQ